MAAEDAAAAEYVDSLTGLALDSLYMLFLQMDEDAALSRCEAATCQRHHHHLKVMVFALDCALRMKIATVLVIPG